MSEIDKWLGIAFVIMFVAIALYVLRALRVADKDADVDNILRLEGGAGKRLDEHRELAELLRKKAPDLLQQHPWVNGWLESQDSYLDRLCQLALRRKAIPEHWSRMVRNRTSGDSHV